MAQSQVVSAVPSTATPNIDGGVVYSIVAVGQWIVAGGSFTSATGPGAATISQNYVVAFDSATGAVNSSFRPSLDGSVNAVLPGPTANTVYVGGLFNHVNGVASKGVTLLNLSNGSIVSTFHPASLNGAVEGMRLSGGRLYIVGGFKSVAGVQHQGIATLNPTTGALDPFMNVQLTDHHNYNGSGANGAVGGRALDISPDGTRAVVVGNFKHANGVLHDQIVMLSLTGSAAAINSNWNTSAYSAPCSSGSFDTYVKDVAFSPDGSYFAVAATGGSTFSNNIDGTRSLCDTAVRWSTTDTGTNVRPTWIDYTGNDTFWSIAVTGTAIYAGGHQRWVNNPSGSDSPGPGSVPRPGIVALDPASGLPLAWNPGRNPRGAGAYALLATANGLYVGSDTNYIGDHRYKRDEIAFFPLAGGYVPASTATGSLPGNVYETGPTNSGTVGSNALAYRNYAPPTIGAQTEVANTGISWSTTRGAFLVGSTIFYGSTDGHFYRASWNGSTVGTPVAIDPYNDPAWVNVATGSGQTYRGVQPNYYGKMSTVTGAFYSDGRLYYTISGNSSLFWRYFTPDSGTIGGAEFTIPGNFSNVAGMFASGTTIYYANRNDGSLHAETYSDGGTNGTNPSVSTSTDHVVSGPAVDGRDWRARGMFLYKAPGPNQAPTARATSSCTGLACTFNGSTSSDPDGSVASYAWTFGDGGTGTGAAPAHTYATPGTYDYSLVVTDNQGAPSAAFRGSVTVTGTAAPAIAFRGSAHATVKSGTSVSVTTPSGIGAGDTELLYVSTANAAADVINTPAGWTRVAAQSGLPLQAVVFAKTATAADAGSTVTATLASAGPIAAQVIGYDNAGATGFVTTGAFDSNTGTHVAPAISVATSGSWVVSFWSDKSSTTTAWTLPSGVASRDQAIGTGGGRVDAALGDSNGPVAVGTYAGRTATVAGNLSGKAAMISLVLTPQA